MEDLLDKRRLADDLGEELQIANPMLLCPEQHARTPQRQVTLGDHKAIVRFGHDPEPLLSFFGW